MLLIYGWRLDIIYHLMSLFKMDFTQLNNEFNSYWSNRNYQSAIQNLQAIDNYVSGGQMDTFLVPYNYILTPPNLLSFYAVETNQDMTILINQIHYTDLINWFAKYLNQIIQTIKSYNDQVAALNAKSSFDKILDSISNALDFITSPAGLIGIGIVIFMIYFMNKQ